MESFASVAIKLSLLFIVHYHGLKGDTNINNIYSNYIRENSSSYRNGSNLTDFSFPLSNSSNLDGTRTYLKSGQVDCFGLGKTLATTLEWFFMSKPNGTNALDVEFSLSSRKQTQRVQVMIGKQFGLEWTDFRIERRTIVIVHGFLSHGQQEWIRDMEKSFLQWVIITFPTFIVDRYCTR